MYNDYKFSERIYMHSGVPFCLSENDDPAPYSLLKKTILDFLTISESEKDKIWTAFGDTLFANAGIQSNTLIQNQYFAQEDTLDTMLALTIGYFCKIWENESTFNETRDNVIRLINKILDKEISWQTEEVCSDKKISPAIDFSLLKGLYISSSAIPQKLFKRLNSYGISKWDDILEISELEIIQRFGFCVKAFDLLLCLWSLRPYAKYMVTLLSPVIDQNTIWNSFESLVAARILYIARNETETQALKRRMGLTTHTQNRLEHIAEALEITKERVIYIEYRLMRMLCHPLRFKELLPLWIVIESFLQNAGTLSVSELALQLQSYFKWEQPPIQRALIYLITKVGTDSVFRKDLHKKEELGFVFAKNFFCNNCSEVCDYLIKTVSHHEEISLVEATDRVDKFCREQCPRDYKHFFHFTYSFIDLLFVGNKRLKKYIRREGDKLYSINRWNLRYGNLSSVVESILKSSSRAMHFKEVFYEVKKLRPADSSLSERNVHAVLSSSRSRKFLLWDRGTFLHKENLAALPCGLIREVEAWIQAKLRQDIPFVSVSGAFQAFKERCTDSGITSEYALYSCLKMSEDNFLVFERFPLIYRKESGKERLPLPMVLEEFIRVSGGPVSLADLKKYAVDTLHLKRYMLHQYLRKIPNINKTKGVYIHTDNSILQAPKGR